MKKKGTRCLDPRPLAKCTAHYHYAEYEESTKQPGRVYKRSSGSGGAPCLVVVPSAGSWPCSCSRPPVGSCLIMKKKGTRCLHQDTKSLITPSLHLCFALTYCLFVCDECIRQSKQHNILTSNCLHENVCCGLGRNKDVGMGL